MQKPVSTTENIQADKPGSLIKRTLDLLKKDGRSIPEIYRDTGIPFFWLRKFAEGKIENPSVNRVQFLYEKLSKRKLQID